MGRVPCCDKNGLKKGPWTPKEDLKLINYIQIHGPGNWRTLPKNAGLQRCGKSCRLRWINYLRPDIKRGRFSLEEEDIIIQLHSMLGNRWSAIAARLPGRTDNEIKNYWNTQIRKRLLRMGIDPVTHAPRLDMSAILRSMLGTGTDLGVGFQGSWPLITSNKILKIAGTLPTYTDLAPQRPKSWLRPWLGNSSLLNMHGLMLGAQAAMMNPDDELLKLAATASLLSMNNGNSDLASPNVQVQSQEVSPPLEFTQFQAPTQSQISNMEDDISGNYNNMVNLSCSSSTLNSNPSSHILQQNQVDLLGKPAANLGNSSIGNANQNMGYDSVQPTPLSSPINQLNSSSACVNSSGEEERDIGYCSSDLFKFEIPEGVDISDFILMSH